jgi:tRNA(Arg) A34 adenosine deaminase TadA
VAEADSCLSPEQIARSVLYTSCEPCAMCVGKMYWAGIRSLVYALPRASWPSWPAAAFWCRAATSSRARRIA